MNIVVDELLAFARANADKKWETAAQKKKFKFSVGDDDAITYVPNLESLWRVQRDSLESFCDEFNRVQSYRPVKYPKSFHKSYTLVLIRAMLEEREESARIPRSDEMVLTAYFLAKYSEPKNDGSNDYAVPVEVGISSWDKVYDRLYPQLHGGRMLEHFAATMYGAISGIGSKLRNAETLAGKEGAITRRWLKASRKELWNEVRKYFEGPLADSPRVVRLRNRLHEVRPSGSPPVPLKRKELKKLQRIITVYERPSSHTRYVKATRGDNCQLCGREHFLKRNGKRYSEVHHVFQLSKNPPVDCLQPEYLVCVCATCHRMLHYAEVGEPERTDDGWAIMVCRERKAFRTQP